MRSGLMVTVVLVFIAALSVYVAVLITMGTKGAELADVMSSAWGALSSAAALASVVVTLRANRVGERKYPPARPSPKWRWIAAGVLGLGGLGVAGYFWLFVKPDIPVTDRATVTEGQRMRLGGEAAIHIPGNPPERRFFSFVPTLVNPTAVGDCVGSARLKIAVMIDGKRTQQQTGLPPQQEITVDLDGVTREATVLVAPDMKDPTCEVDLSLAEAVLYN